MKFWPALLPFVIVAGAILSQDQSATAQDGMMGGGSVAGGKMDGGKMVAAADEKLRRANPGCIACHTGIEVMHPWDPLTCTECHGGDGKANSKEKAHVPPRRPTQNDERTVDLGYDLAYRQFMNPSDLRVTAKTCNRCHSTECANIPKSLHGTTAGHLSDGLYENGILRDRKKRYAIFPTKDEDGSVPKHGYRSMPAIPVPSIGFSTSSFHVPTSVRSMNRVSVLVSLSTKRTNSAAESVLKPSNVFAPICVLE